MKKDKPIKSAATYPAVRIAAAVGGLFVIVITALVLFGPIQARSVFEQIFSAEPESEVSEKNIEIDLAQFDEGLEMVEENNAVVEIIGFEPMSDSICLAIRLEQVPAFRINPGFDEDSDPGAMRQQLDERLKQIYLIDQNGQKYQYQGGNFVAEHTYYSGCTKGAAWSSEVLLELPELSEKAQTLTMVITLSGDEKLKKEISLSSLEEVGECSLPGVRITW